MAWRSAGSFSTNTTSVTPGEASVEGKGQPEIWALAAESKKEAGSRRTAPGGGGGDAEGLALSTTEVDGLALEQVEQQAPEMTAGLQCSLYQEKCWGIFGVVGQAQGQTTVWECRTGIWRSMDELRDRQGTGSSI